MKKYQVIAKQHDDFLISFNVKAMAGENMLAIDFKALYNSGVTSCNIWSIGLKERAAGRGGAWLNGAAV